MDDIFDRTKVLEDNSLVTCPSPPESFDGETVNDGAQFTAFIARGCTLDTGVMREASGVQF